MMHLEFVLVGRLLIYNKLAVKLTSGFMNFVAERISCIAPPRGLLYIVGGEG